MNNKKENSNMDFETWWLEQTTARFREDAKELWGLDKKAFEELATEANIKNNMTNIDVTVYSQKPNGKRNSKKLIEYVFSWVRPGAKKQKLFEKSLGVYNHKTGKKVS